MSSPHHDDRADLVAGRLRLAPATADERIRAEAAGLTTDGAVAVWTARDADTGVACAYVVRHDGRGEVRAAAVAAREGAGPDAVLARDAVLRHAAEVPGAGPGAADG